MSQEIELFGAPGSPYTRKMVAWLRFRRIPYKVSWSRHDTPEGYPEPKVRLLPTFYLPGESGELEAVVDSTPIIRRLETEIPGRSTLPLDPAVAFLNDLIEDYGDEWTTKMMFHYRWAFERDAQSAGPLLATFSDPTITDGQMNLFAKNVTVRQINRLYVVGSNDVTAPIIEDSFHRLIRVLDSLIQARGYCLGNRPSSADFAIYGQFTQLATVEPTPMEILMSEGPRVRSWILRMEDLSGIEVDEADWLSQEEARSALSPLLAEIGRTYVPVILANAHAIDKGETEFETEVDGHRWWQPTFNYQAKCLQWLRMVYFQLDKSERQSVNEILDGTGCELLVAKSTS